jgi:hypothetical protein
MNVGKLLNKVLYLLVFASLFIGSSTQTQSVVAMPSSPTDESKVPHYFGPYPNWANSPLTVADAQVVITGNGTGATAEATVGPIGAITGITVPIQQAAVIRTLSDILGSEQAQRLTHPSSRRSCCRSHSEPAGYGLAPHLR